MFDFSPMCVFRRHLKSPARKDARSHWLQVFGFLQCFYQMRLQSTFIGRCKVTLVAFVVLFQMCTHMTQVIVFLLAHVAIVWYSPLCVFEWVWSSTIIRKWSFWTKTHSGKLRWTQKLKCKQYHRCQNACQGKNLNGFRWGVGYKNILSYISTILWSTM